MHEKLSAGQLQAIAQTLWQGIEVDPHDNMFSELTLPPGWQEINVGFADLYKLRAFSNDLGVFVKMYAPATDDLARRVGSAIEALSQLETNVAVLPLVGFIDCMHLFPLGILKGSKPRKDWFNEEELQSMSGAIKPFYVGLSAWIDIVEVEGREYAVDVVDDTP